MEERSRREQLQRHRGRFLHVPDIREGFFSQGFPEINDVITAAAGLFSHAAAAAAAAAARFPRGRRSHGGLGLVEGEHCGTLMAPGKDRSGERYVGGRREAG